MDKISYDYSMKNIPIPPESSYLKNLIEKVEKFIKRLQWKACFLNIHATTLQVITLVLNRTKRHHKMNILTHSKMTFMNLSKTSSLKTLKTNSKTNSKGT